MIEKGKAKKKAKHPSINTQIKMLTHDLRKEGKRYMIIILDDDRVMTKTSLRGTKEQQAKDILRSTAAIGRTAGRYSNRE